MGAAGSFLLATDLNRDSSRLHRQRDPYLSSLKPLMLPIGREGPAIGVDSLRAMGCSWHISRIAADTFCGQLAGGNDHRQRRLQLTRDGCPPRQNAARQRR